MATTANLRNFEEECVESFRNPEDMYRSALKALKNVRKLVTKAWVRGAYRYEADRIGDDVLGIVSDNNAKEAFCLVGALNKVDGKAEDFAAGVLFTCLPPAIKQTNFDGTVAVTGSIITFNDNVAGYVQGERFLQYDVKKAHRQVLALVDRGIKKLERKLEKV